MKRWGHLLEQVADINNIELADDKARRGKHNIGIVNHDKNRHEENLKLSESIRNLTYKTSEYTTFTIHEPKERVIFRLPYYPDRIAHHAIMNVMELKWVNIMIPNTFACIKGRGIHKLNKVLRRDLKDVDNTKYCLKLDIHKFYPSIDHDILKSILKLRIKDYKFLLLLDSIIDSSTGVPIGNYLSLFFANIYLTPFDHWIKDVLKIKYYYRYCDDIVILGSNKDDLRNALNKIKEYLDCNLKLQLKPNYLIYPVDSRGIDFVGYKFYHTHVLLRKSLKERYKKLLAKYLKNIILTTDFKHRVVSYFGWMKFCNSKTLLYALQMLTGFKFSNWLGIDSKISKFYNKELYMIEIIPYSKYFKINFIYRNKSYSVKSKSKLLYNTFFKYHNINIKIYENTKKNSIRNIA